ncbi:thermonuclease family protein, partial [Klebsiella pneumoniae]|nr:thermonuclease family protein [Klebsiella pneumoniae]
ETHHPEEPVEPWGPEAEAFAKEQLLGKKVQLEIGKDSRGKYDRLLAYVYVNGEMFNEMLLKEGLARVAYIYPPNLKYV